MPGPAHRLLQALGRRCQRPTVVRMRSVGQRAAPTCRLLSSSSSSSSTGERRVLVHGGRGALGQAMVSQFRDAGWHVTSCDFAPNQNATHNIVLKKSAPWQENAQALAAELRDQQLQAVVCSAGGFAMGPVKDTSFLETADRMISMNLFTSFTAAHVAANFLAARGLLVFTGAAGALQRTPAMAAYGASKSAVHHLVASMADDLKERDALSVGVLPVTIDTAQNRKDMPTADFSTWTPPSHFAARVVAWADHQPSPVSGGLYCFKTTGGKTEVELVDSAL